MVKLLSRRELSLPLHSTVFDIIQRVRESNTGLKACILVLNDHRLPLQATTEELGVKAGNHVCTAIVQSSSDLKGIGYTARHSTFFGHTVSELRDIGHTPGQLKAAGRIAADLKKCWVFHICVEACRIGCT